MRELLATQRGWVALEETGDAGRARELAVAEAGRHGGVGAVTTTQATVAGGLLDEFLGALLLPEGPQEGQSCSRALMVRMKGLEPSRLTALVPKRADSVALHLPDQSSVQV